MRTVVKATAAIGIIVLLSFGVYATLYFSTYNNLVAQRNQVTAQYQFMLASYDRFYTNTVLSKQVAQYSVNAQIQLNQIVATERSGNSIKGSNIQAQVSNARQIDSLSTQFFATFTAEAVPKLDTTQLTELNAIIESNLRVVNHDRNAFSQQVASYNTATQSFPANIWASGWGFEQSQGYQPTQINLPESLNNNSSLGLNLPKP